MRRWSIVLGAVALVLAVTSGPALAESPFRVAGQITDRAGALVGQESRVQSALDDLRTQNRTSLYVVYVSSFQTPAGTDWAASTAGASSLGPSDVLLAVAVDDRAYQWWISDSSSLSSARIDGVFRSTVEPAVSRGDWAAAAIEGAQGLQSLSRSVPDPWSPTSTAVVVGVAVLVLVVGHVLSRRPAGFHRRRRDTLRPA